MFHPKLFPLAYPLAARRAERLPSPAHKIADIQDWGARQAYEGLQEILTRLDAGETLEAIAADHEAQMRKHSEKSRRKMLAKPEPKDKTSDEWRHWKLRQWEAAFKQGADDAAAYTRAWTEFRALFDGLIADGDFWNVRNALALAPDLLIARRDIDRINAHERRDQARVAKQKGAKKG